MRKDFPQDALPEPLLSALENRVHAAPALEAEWAQAWREWPAAGADPRVRERFREWFLLERESAALGMPPAAAWAPRELGERDEDPWTRLLEAQFRVLRVDADADAEHADLTDLWSGQRFEGVPLPAAAREARLLLGRVAPHGLAGGRILAGWRSLDDDVIADALAGDLARVRAEQPRARLSQRECELLLAPHWDQARRSAASGPTEEERLRQLAALLEAAPGWDLARAVAALDRGGPAELLEQLAFETAMPLEPLRTLLAEWTAEQFARASAPEPSAPGDERLQPETVARALAAFDRARAQGTDLDRAWTQLQEALDLEDAAPIREEEALWKDVGPAEPIGPGRLPGLEFWIEAWCWERERLGEPVRAAEREAASAFGRFVESVRQGELDASELSAADLWNHYASSPNLEQLGRRERELADFLRWLREEQDAFVAGDPQDWSESDWARLRASVELNAILRARALPIAVTTRLAAIAPPRVATEQGEWIEVAGLPPGAGGAMRRGDLLAGAWTAGRFHAAGWFPQPGGHAESGAEA